MRVYLASRYRDFPLMQQWREFLEDNNCTVTSRWINGDHEITENANDDKARSRFAVEDVEDILSAQIFICRSDPSFFRSGRGGRHVELGIALACKKVIVLVGQRENVFHYLPQVSVVSTIEEVVEFLREVRA
jgi:hypothetical protein